MYIVDNIKLFWRLGLILLIYLICRILFFFYNFNDFDNNAFTEIVSAVFLGLRFDISAIFTLNSLLIVLSIIPFGFTNQKYYQYLLKTMYLLVNGFFITLNLIDVVFYSYTNRRMTIEILQIWDDVLPQIHTSVLQYWYILGFIVFTWWIIGKCYYIYPKGTFNRIYSYINYQKNQLDQTHPEGRGFFYANKKWQALVLMVLVVGVSVILARNSFGARPLSPGHAFRFSSSSLSNLALNTPFVFMKSMVGRAVKRRNYFTKNRLQSILMSNRVLENKVLYNSSVKPNIVLIVLESFSTEYVGLEGHKPVYAPFLNSLAHKGLFFKNAYANARNSIRSLPAILVGIPSLMKDSFTTSIYQSNTVYGIGHILKKEGYSTMFFHGGRNGSMGLDYLSRLTGFDEYYGMDEYYDSSKDYDGAWGIIDEAFLKLFKGKIDVSSKPFLGVFFSLSSHHPFFVPAKYQGKFAKGTQDIHESIGYVDNALRNFFQAASKMDWYSNTLFIITADHTHRIHGPENNPIMDRFDVPLIFYSPGQTLPKIDTERVVQHTDLLPSIVNYLGIRTKLLLPFGNSVFSDVSNSSDNKGEALYQYDGKYVLLGKSHYLTYTDASGSKFYAMKSKRFGQKKVIQEKQEQEMEEKLKAYLQFYYNGLIDNSWYH